MLTIVCCLVVGLGLGIGLVWCRVMPNVCRRQKVDRIHSYSLVYEIV